MGKYAKFIASVKLGIKILGLVVLGAVIGISYFYSYQLYTAMVHFK